MKMECIVQKKIEKLFELIVQPGYVMDNYYADSFINKLSNCFDPEVSPFVSTPVLSDCILQAWEKTEHAHNTVKVFVTRILAVAAKRELHFAKIAAKIGQSIAQNFKDIQSPKMTSSLKVAYMEVALAVVDHNSGAHWLITTEVWKDILNLSSEKQTVFVLRQTYKFGSKLIWKLNECPTQGYHNIKTVFEFILKPLGQYDFLQGESLTSEHLEDISRNLEPMLQMLLSILSVYPHIEKSNVVVNILLEDSMLQPHLRIIFDRIRDNHLTLLLSKVSFLLFIAKTFNTKPMITDVSYKYEDFIEAIVWYFNFVHELIRRRNPVLVLDFCNSINLIWNTLWLDKSRPMFENNKSTIKLHNQLLLLCLVPSLVYLTRRGTKISDELINEYIYKLVNLSCEHTAKACYALRDLLNDMDLVSITLQGVKRLTCLKNHMNNEQANLVFQAMFYILKEYDPTSEDTLNEENSRTESYEESEEKLVVITYVLDMVLSLVKEHDINWHESLEIICLYNVVYNILKRPNLTCKFVVLALNVIALTVKKFLPPNLSLLLDTKPGSAIDELGKLIYLKMNDRNWEIRDSALELLLVCTEISYIKFPHLQKQILENKLINTAATIALHDHEFYVQASALKCVAAATRIGSVWNQLIVEHPNIQDHLLSILRNSQEGIVRKEACNVLCDVYLNIKQTPEFQRILYNQMSSSALEDFHWEVQLMALKFWRVTIHSLLRDQGMLDGTFPPVTFSRQTRKIVNLDEVEIQRRLKSILDQLSTIGCLTILIKLLDEESEIEIMETALSIAQELQSILIKYKVPQCLKPKDDDPMTVEELVCCVKDESNGSSENITDNDLSESDHVIESILNVDDVNLLANIYDRQMNLGSKFEDIKPIITLMKAASPYLFVSYLQSKDFKEIIKQKRQWKDGIRSLQSLLDDVLGIYNVNYEVNELDCY